MAVAGSTINNGDFALKATEAAWVTARQIEAARRAMTRHARRGGKMWIRVISRQIGYRSSRRDQDG